MLHSTAVTAASIMCVMVALLTELFYSFYAGKYKSSFYEFRSCYCFFLVIIALLLLQQLYGICPLTSRLEAWLPWISSYWSAWTCILLLCSMYSWLLAVLAVLCSILGTSYLTLHFLFCSFIFGSTLQLFTSTVVWATPLSERQRSPMPLLKLFCTLYLYMLHTLHFDCLRHVMVHTFNVTVLCDV